MNFSILRSHTAETTGMVTHDWLMSWPDTVAVAQFWIGSGAFTMAVKVNVAVYDPVSVTVLVQLRLLEVVPPQFQSAAGLTVKGLGRLKVIPVGCWSPTTTVPGAQVCPAGTVKVMVTCTSVVPSTGVTVFTIARSHLGQSTVTVAEAVAK